MIYICYIYICIYLYKYFFYFNCQKKVARNIYIDIQDIYIYICIYVCIYVCIYKGILPIIKKKWLKICFYINA